METLDDIKKKLDALVKDAVEEIASLQKGRPRFHVATREKGDKKRGVGYTRKNRSESKRRRNIAKASRKINRRK